MENKVNSELRAAFTIMPEMNFNRDNINEIRMMMNEMVMISQQPQYESILVSNRFIPGPAGAPKIRVRIYEPRVKEKNHPGLLWIHGGGYILGIPEADETLCQRFVSEVNCIVVSVDYRLAPENPFPAPVEDCYAALKWFSENADALSTDPSCIAVAGTSAGGGLTAAVSLMARDRKGPSIAFQMPLYPMIDHRNNTPSSFEITDKRVWNREQNMIAWKMYLDTNNDEDVSPYASPALASNFSDLPPTYTCIGDLDPFRDETINYISRLSQAGVPTEFHLYPGCFHGFEEMVPNAEISQRAIAQIVQALKRAFQK